MCERGRTKHSERFRTSVERGAVAVTEWSWCLSSGRHYLVYKRICKNQLKFVLPLRVFRTGSITKSILI